jgi:hypothetical protein
MTEIFSWWHGSNLQISIVLFLLLCILGTLVSLALCADKRSNAEQAADDEDQERVIQAARSAWMDQA